MYARLGPLKFHRHTRQCFRPVDRDFERTAGPRQLAFGPPAGRSVEGAEPPDSAEPAAVMGSNRIADDGTETPVGADGCAHSASWAENRMAGTGSSAGSFPRTVTSTTVANTAAIGIASNTARLPKRTSTERTETRISSGESPTA